MPNVRLPPESGGFAEKLSYRLDRFLSLHPVLQLAAVLVWATLVALLFGALSLLFTDDAKAGLDGGLWWAITHMLDGGAVAGDKGPWRRFMGIGVTLAGTVLVALVTGAFASSFVARLRDVRRGTFQVFERGHIVFLGYGPRADLLLRELAASGLPTTIVIVTPMERDLADEQVRAALHGTRHRLRVIVRRADPGTTSGVRGAALVEARAVVILPEIDAIAPSSPTAGCAHTPEDRAVMRSMLAARRVLGGARVPVIAEITGERGRELVELCTRSTDLTLVDEGDLSAHLLVHAVRQCGVLDVVRQVLSLDARSVYIHTPGPFTGKTFEQAHAALGPGLLIGLLRHRKNILSPPGHLVIEAADRLLVLANDAAEPTPCAPFPSQEGPSSPPSSRSWTSPLHVLVIGHRRGHATLLRALKTHFVQRVTLLVPPEHAAEARAALEASGFAADAATLLVGHPTDPALLARAADGKPTRLFLLASDAAPARAAEVDADQLLTLLQLRRLLPGGTGDPPAVVEIHRADTEALVEANRSTEFVLVREITGMLVGQELHAICLDAAAGAWLGDVLRQLLVEICTRIWLRPLGAYVSGTPEPTFADVMTAARARGETAIGVRLARGRAHLLPARGERFDPRDTDVIVIAAPEPARAPATEHRHREAVA